MALRVKLPLSCGRTACYACPSSLCSRWPIGSKKNRLRSPLFWPTGTSCFHSSSFLDQYSAHGVTGSPGRTHTGRRRQKPKRYPPRNVHVHRSLPTFINPPYMLPPVETKDESLMVGRRHGSNTVTLPCSVRDLDHTSLALLGSFEHHVQALEEMLKRHIMQVDRVDYKEACQIFALIETKNHQYEHYMAAPFQIAIVLCGGGALLSVPLVFSLPVVEFFNEHFVTAEHPQPKELETALEVGSWSWNWMEPVLGTSTFVLLCLQYMRIHLNHLGVQPFTARMKRFRARNLIQAFPRYNAELLTSYSQASAFYNAKDLWF